MNDVTHNEAGTTTPICRVGHDEAEWARKLDIEQGLEPTSLELIETAVEELLDPDSDSQGVGIVLVEDDAFLQQLRVLLSNYGHQDVNKMRLVDGVRLAKQANELILLADAALAKYVESKL